MVVPRAPMMAVMPFRDAIVRVNRFGAPGVRVPAVTLLGSGRVGRGQALVTDLNLNRGSTS